MCNLASIALPRFVIVKAGPTGRTEAKKLRGSTDAARSFDLDDAHRDHALGDPQPQPHHRQELLPRREASFVQHAHRPIGIGVQGLADVFILLGCRSRARARALNRRSSRRSTLPRSAASNDIAKRDGPTSRYAGSPVSKGVLQFDMWGVTPSTRWDWAGLKAKIKEHGVRNSLLLAPMPTASTAQILGNNECFEPYTSNIYARRVLSGEFTVVNQHLLSRPHRDGPLGPRDPQPDHRAQRLGAAHPGHPRRPQGDLQDGLGDQAARLVDMAADRGAFIDQSQSFNVFMTDPNYGKLSSMHF